MASKVRKNSHGRPISYDLISHRVRRHSASSSREGGTYDADMDFINHDFWVTRTESGFTDYIDVPRYAKAEATADRPADDDLAVHAGAARRPQRGLRPGERHEQLHRRGDHDLGRVLLKPRDLFDGTPLYRQTERSPRFLSFP